MIHRDPSSGGAPRPRPLLLGLAALLGVCLGIFGLLFVMVNDAWAVIHIPSPPWSADESWAAFEARVAAIVLASFVAGAVAAAALGRFLSSRLRRRLAQSQASHAALEAELQNVSRLLASSRDKG